MHMQRSFQRRFLLSLLVVVALVMSTTVLAQQSEEEDDDFVILQDEVAAPAKPEEPVVVVKEEEPVLVKEEPILKEEPVAEEKPVVVDIKPELVIEKVIDSVVDPEPVPEPKQVYEQAPQPPQPQELPVPKEEPKVVLDVPSPAADDSAAPSPLTKAKSSLSDSIDCVVKKGQAFVTRCKNADASDMKKVAAAAIGIWGISVGVGWLAKNAETAAAPKPIVVELTPRGKK